MKKNLITASLISALLLSAGCSSSSSGAASSSSSETPEIETAGTQMDAAAIDAMTDLEVYTAARTAALYYAAYTPESFSDFFNAWIAIDLMPTVDDNIAAIESGDEDMAAMISALRDSYKNLVQTAEYSEVTYDIWEGHDVIPTPNGTDPNHYSDAQACLADDDGFRPFISDYRLDDPSGAKGTIITIPSIRAGFTECAQVAAIFNEMGYNVFCCEPRMDTVEGLSYTSLYLDVQRSIRYVKYHAEELGIDPDKIVTLAGSKGNMSHPLCFNYYDYDPVEYTESLGATLEGYEPDEIDEITSDVAVMCVDYGSAGLAGFGNTFTEEIITNSRIYSEENYANGLKFPDILIMTGNLDSDTLNDPAVITGLYNYNHLEDKLYTVNYEVHIFNNVAHGFGAGTQYPNLTAAWQEAGIFIESCLNAEE